MPYQERSSGLRDSGVAPPGPGAGGSRNRRRYIRRRFDLMVARGVPGAGGSRNRRRYRADSYPNGRTPGRGGPSDPSARDELRYRPVRNGTGRPATPLSAEQEATSPRPEPADGLRRGVVIDAEARSDRLEGNASLVQAGRVCRHQLVPRRLEQPAEVQLHRHTSAGASTFVSGPPTERSRTWIRTTVRICSWSCSQT